MSSQRQGEVSLAARLCLEESWRAGSSLGRGENKPRARARCREESELTLQRPLWAAWLVAIPQRTTSTAGRVWLARQVPGKGRPLGGGRQLAQATSASVGSVWRPERLPDCRAHPVAFHVLLFETSEEAHWVSRSTVRMAHGIMTSLGGRGGRNPTTSL